MTPECTENEPKYVIVCNTYLTWKNLCQNNEDKVESGIYFCVSYNMKSNIFYFKYNFRTYFWSNFKEKFPKEGFQFLKKLYLTKVIMINFWCSFKGIFCNKNINLDVYAIAIIAWL